MPTIKLLQRVLEGRNILRTIKSGRADWIGHILRRKCHIKHVIEERRRKDRRDG